MNAAKCLACGEVLRSRGEVNEWEILLLVVIVMVVLGATIVADCYGNPWGR
jgi:hypothetical protein